MPRPIDADALMEYCNNLKDKTIDANDIARFPTAVGWISVKDRLPEIDTNVLWCAKYEPERVNAIRLSDHKWDIRVSAFTGCTNHGIPDVESYGAACIPLYWMPLPELPEET